ncbi:hypothetical protein F4861DRAFT_536279 [Xylaria intraflava]|nr:hypothetical protein F4861DRAFT_536279 [Xylaria intraflava]
MAFSPMDPTVQAGNRNQQPARIAIKGFGGLIGRRHTAHVLSNASAVLAAVVDDATNASSPAARLKPGVPYYWSVTKMLSIALELVEAGIHLLVEKPLADTKASACTFDDHA